MKLWSEFIPLVSMRLPECPIWTIEDEARMAAIDFFVATRVWRDVTFQPLGLTVALTSSYDVPAITSETVLAGITEAWLETRRLREAQNAEWDNEDARSDLPEDGLPTLIRVLDEDTVQLRPTPVSGGEALRIIAAYAPSEASTGIESDAAFAEFKEAIEHRIVSRCKAHTNKPWSDARGSAAADREYTILKLKFGGKAGSRGQRRRQRRQAI